VFDRFFFPKMEAMRKHDVEAETCEHAQNREHGNALTKPLSLVKDCVSFEQSHNACIVLLFP
jgi:hypothetical protein